MDDEQTGLAAAGPGRKRLDDFREALHGHSGNEMAQELLAELESRYGEAPLVARVLAREPGVYIPSALKNAAVLRDSPLGPRIAELVAVGAAAALHCDYCLNVHSEQALRAGASEEELLSAMLIAGAIAESSVQAYAFRALDKATRQRRQSKEESNDGK